MAEKEPDKRYLSRPGRVRSALRVLRGDALVPDQILSEWIEYQQIFSDLLSRFSASLARQAKLERSRVKDLAVALDESSEPSFRPSPPVSRKAELRSRAAALRGLAPKQQPISNRVAPMFPAAPGALNAKVAEPVVAAPELFDEIPEEKP